MKTITFQEFSDSDYEEVSSQYWRHGRRIRYLFRDENDAPYLTEFMDVSSEDCIMNYSGKVNIFPARQVMKPAWEVVK